MLDEKKQQLGCVEEKLRWVQLCKAPQGKTEQLKNVTFIEMQQESSTNEVKLTSRFRLDVRLLKQPRFCEGSLQSLHFQLHELICWQWKSFTHQTSVLTECTR